MRIQIWYVSRTWKQKWLFCLCKLTFLFFCTSDQDNEVKFSVLHVKNHQGLIEPSVDHSRSHIKWNVSSLSPVGPVVQTSKPAEHHGVVQVYKEVGQQDSYSFRVYLATNNDSDITVRILLFCCSAVEFSTRCS